MDYLKNAKSVIKGAEDLTSAPLIFTGNLFNLVRFSDDEIQNMLNVKKSRAYNIVKSMKDKGALVTKGRGNDKKHYLK